MTIEVFRHKTAIKRGKLSLPVQTALDSGLIQNKDTFFDYGCGYGEDIKILKKDGFNAFGWDPFFSPAEPDQDSFNIVNLGYVINVLEVFEERDTALAKAYRMAEDILIVSAMLEHDKNQTISRPYKDGFISSRNTFQKYYTQKELRDYIDDGVKLDKYNQDIYEPIKLIKDKIIAKN